MTIKKGYFYNQYPNENLFNWNFVWYVGQRGLIRDSMFKSHWTSDTSYEHNIAKGLVLVPQVLDIPNFINEMGSSHLGLLHEINVGMKATKTPVIIDYLAAPKGKVLNYDQLRAYIGNIKEHWLPFLHDKKPLLRASYAIWLKWFTDNPSETAEMLRIVQPLVAQWGAVKPASIYSFGMPKWWEYFTDDIAYMGKIAYDETSNWEESPNETPVIVDPPIEKPVVEEPIVDPVENSPKKYKISLLGGLIRGTIEEI